MGASYRGSFRSSLIAMAVMGMFANLASATSSFLAYSQGMSSSVTDMCTLRNSQNKKRRLLRMGGSTRKIGLNHRKIRQVKKKARLKK